MPRRVRGVPCGALSTLFPVRCQGYPHMRYDTTLKALFQAPPQELLRLLVGGQAREMLTVEYPSVRLRRPDLVVRLTDGRLYHLELQSTNDPTMPWRMLDYYSLLRQHHGQAPQQQILYVGEAPLALASHLTETTLSFHYEVIDGLLSGGPIEGPAPDARTTRRARHNSVLEASHPQRPPAAEHEALLPGRL